MGRPHIYGFAWEEKDGQQSPVVRDFQGNEISEMLGEDAQSMLRQTAQQPSEKELNALREYLVDLGVFPHDGEMLHKVELNQLQEKLSGPVLRECYHQIVDKLFLEEQKSWEASSTPEAKVIVSELSRGRQLMQGDRPMSMVEAVRDFLDMGPYGAYRPTALLAALDDLYERIEAYQELPAPFDIDEIITDPSKMGLQEMIKNPDWIQDTPNVDADELRRSFGPEPL